MRFPGTWQILLHACGKTDTRHFLLENLCSMDVTSRCSGNIYMQVLQKFGEARGDPLARTFWREKDSISGFLFWTQRTFRFYVWGPSGTLARNRALLS
jgi:hypothetical protein